jgi:hypothetical protein
LLEEKDNNSPLFVVTKLWYRLWNLEEGDKATLEQAVDQAYAEKDKVAPKIQLFTARCSIKNINKNHQAALETVNEGIVYYPTFIPFLTDKCVCLMALGDW